MTYQRKTPKKVTNLKRKHPYMNLNSWLSGKLAFWRRPLPGSLFRYNVDMYESLLTEQVKSEKNLVNFESNIGH